MMIGLALVVFVAMGAAFAAGPVGRHDPDALRRRRRQVLHHFPERASAEDLAMLLADAVPPVAVRPLVTRIRQRHLDAPQLWRWTEANGPTALGLALCADFDATDFGADPSHDQRTFDTTSLRLLAELNGGGLGRLVVAGIDARPALPAPDAGTARWAA